MLRRDFLKLGAASMVTAPFVSAGATAQQTKDRITIRWLGGATMEIKIGEIRLLTDPCFGEGSEAFLMPDPNEQFDPQRGPNVRAHARLSDFPGLSADRYDAVLLSHAHEDHFDGSARIWLGNAMPLICPIHDAPQLAEGGFDVQPMRHLTTRIFERGDSRVEIIAIAANHSPNSNIA